MTQTWGRNGKLFPLDVPLGDLIFGSWSGLFSVRVLWWTHWMWTFECLQLLRDITKVFSGDANGNALPGGVAGRPEVFDKQPPTYETPTSITQCCGGTNLV